MTTDHYEANDREYDETQEMLVTHNNTPEEILRDYAEWVRKGGCVGYDGHVENADISLGCLTLTYYDGTILRLHMTCEYIGNRDHADNHDDSWGQTNA